MHTTHNRTSNASTTHRLICTHTPTHTYTHTVSTIDIRPLPQNLHPILMGYTPKWVIVCLSRIYQHLSTPYASPHIRTYQPYVSTYIHHTMWLNRKHTAKVDHNYTRKMFLVHRHKEHNNRLIRHKYITIHSTDQNILLTSPPII